MLFWFFFTLLSYNNISIYIYCILCYDLILFLFKFGTIRRASTRKPWPMKAAEGMIMFCIEQLPVSLIALTKGRFEASCRGKGKCL